MTLCHILLMQRELGKYVDVKRKLLCPGFELRSRILFSTTIMLRLNLCAFCLCVCVRARARVWVCVLFVSLCVYMCVCVCLKIAHNSFFKKMTHDNFNLLFVSKPTEVVFICRLIIIFLTSSFVSRFSFLPFFCFVLHVLLHFPRHSVKMAISRWPAFVSWALSKQGMPQTRDSSFSLFASYSDRYPLPPSPLPPLPLSPFPPPPFLLYSSDPTPPSSLL